MKVIENLTVYKNQYGFSTMLKNNEDKMYISVNFRKGAEPQNEVNKIIITDGFLSFFKDKNGLARPKIVVLEYLMQEENAFDNAVVVDDSSNLPF